ncbi:unnamed protein product [Rhizopus stolonifer]
MVKILVANRGEIAIRVITATQELGHLTVAVYTNDQDKTHCQRATESIKISSFLNTSEIIQAAKKVNATAIHPGYGFLSESSHLANECMKSGLIFIGPSASLIDCLGDKLSARKMAQKANLPVIPGAADSVSSIKQVIDFGRQQGYPIMLKARDGGGGRGIRIVKDEQQIEETLARCKNESTSGQVFMERVVQQAKHIEVQILGDRQGNCVHLFERDCSIQRRYQKVLEIAPSNLSFTLRNTIHQAAIRLARYLAYDSVGTIEFLVVPERNEFYFLEVNPRIQVEHTISEQITQVDIVQAQIRIALGESILDLGLQQENIQPNHLVSIQARVVAEDPLNNNMISVGKIGLVEFPLGAGIRIDTWIQPGSIVLPMFDSLLAKVIVTGQSYQDAISKLKLALTQVVITGVETNLGFLVSLLSSPLVQNAHTHSLEENMKGLVQSIQPVSQKASIQPTPILTHPVQFKPGDAFDIQISQKSITSLYSLQIDSISSNRFPEELAAVVHSSNHPEPLSIVLSKKAGLSSTLRKANPHLPSEIASPVTGMLVETVVKRGDSVKQGQALFVMSAMNMETVVYSSQAGKVKRVNVN